VNRDQYGWAFEARVLVDFACAQDDAEAQNTDIGSGDELEDTTPRDPSSAEENVEDLQWHPHFPLIRQLCY
jgi:hypothetical protein